MKGFYILTFSLFLSNIYSQTPNDGCGNLSTVNQTSTDGNGNTIILEYDIENITNNTVATLSSIDDSYSSNSTYNTSTGYLYLGKENHLMVYDVNNSYNLLGRIDLVGNSVLVNNNLFSKDNFIGYINGNTLVIIDVSTTTTFPATISPSLITETTLNQSLSGVNDFIMIENKLYGIKGISPVLYIIDVTTGVDIQLIELRLLWTHIV